MSAVSDIITAVRYDLKDDGTVAKISDAKIMHYMNRFRVFLAATLFREQCSISLKKANIVTGSDTSTYAFLSSAADFYADYGLHYSTSASPLVKRGLDEYIANGYNTATAVGTAGNYMILGTTLYLFGDIPDAVSTLSLWYYSQPVAFTATTDTMPFNGIFDEPWRQFITTLLLNRDEYSANFEQQLLGQIEIQVLRGIIGWSVQPKMIPFMNPGTKREFTIGRDYYL
jgi:hypothetical protein